MVTQSQIQQLVNEIAEGYKPEKIYLFGSYANGTPTKDSDIDLFIVKETETRRIHRIKEVLDTLDFNSYPIVGIDFIIYTPKELEVVKDYVINIANIAMKTGKIMYERV